MSLRTARLRTGFVSKYTALPQLSLKFDQYSFCAWSELTRQTADNLEAFSVPVAWMVCSGRMGGNGDATGAPAVLALPPSTTRHISHKSFDPCSTNPLSCFQRPLPTADDAFVLHLKPMLKRCS